MATNEKNGTDALLANNLVRDTLLNHHQDTAKVLAALASAGIVFNNDPKNAKRDAVVAQIGKIDWSQIRALEVDLNAGDGTVHPFDA